MQNPPSNKSVTSQKSKTKSKAIKNKRQRNRRKNKKKLASQQSKVQPPHPTAGSSTASIHKQSGADIWRKVYENSIRWHAEHQGNFWRQLALKLENENEKLKNDLDTIRSSVHCEVYEEEESTSIKVHHSTTSLQDESDKVDSGYLEFLETTIQHQKEIRMTRQLEDWN